MSVKQVTGEENLGRMLSIHLLHTHMETHAKMERERERLRRNELFDGDTEK